MYNRILLKLITQALKAENEKKQREADHLLKHKQLDYQHKVDRQR
jgi:hypothetical protein